MQSLYKLKRFKILILVIAFILSIFLFVPKTYAMDTSRFSQYANQYHEGRLDYSDDIMVAIKITQGPAGSGNILIFEIPNQYVGQVHNIHGGSSFLKFEPAVGKWEVYYPSWSTFSNVPHSGTITNFISGGEEKARVHVGGSVNYYFDFTFNKFNGTPEIGSGVIWNPTTQIWEIQDKKPVINGETAFVTNIDALISIDEIKSKITAIDNEDGNISHKIQVDSNGTTYNQNITTLGTYKIKFYVVDTAGNRADLTVHVLVKDITVPVITGPKTYNESYTKKKDVGTILASLSATDNYDTGLTVKVKTDNYTPNYNKVGSYGILFYATDSSGNEGLYTVTVNVIDDVAPVFSGPTTFMKGQTETLTLAQILEDITVNDVVDKNVTFTVKSDNYTGNGAKVGSYKIVLEATDESGNTATHTITITVRDDIPPVFYVDNFFINVDETLTLTRDDIINLLIASGQLIVEQQTQVNFMINEYEGNENIPGIYALVLETKAPSGNTNKISLAVKVNENTDEDPVIINPEENIIDKLWNFIKDSWNWLKSPINENSKFRNGYYVVIGLFAIGFISGFAGIINKKPRFRKYSRSRRRYRR